MVLGVLAMAYVGSYIFLSRQAFREADRHNMAGFWFVNPPRDSENWRSLNYGLARFYYPLIVVDNLLGTGRVVAAEPMWRLEGGRSAGNAAPVEREGRWQETARADSPCPLPRALAA